MAMYCSPDYLWTLGIEIWELVEASTRFIIFWQGLSISPYTCLCKIKWLLERGNIATGAKLGRCLLVNNAVHHYLRSISCGFLISKLPITVNLTQNDPCVGANIDTGAMKLHKLVEVS